jgi:DNA topoisomerase-1
MANNLVIVESPAKAKTIEKYLGKDYEVKSSFGHIRDLAKKDLGIDVDNDFKPTYVNDSGKKKVIADLKKLAKQAETIWLASDEDREGEAIAWHLFEALNLSEEKTKRIVFHEITKDAIQNAIKNPREIDKNLVDAQQARRVLDRIVGFKLSPLLWKKVKPSLSAGRVQSVAVRLIVEREKEIINHKAEIYYKVSAVFNTHEEEVVKAEIGSKFKSLEEAEKFLESCKNAKFSVGDISKKPATRKPSPPFTTSTLQQEASRKLGYSVSKTMTVAQQLYEAGYITYMRTDSFNLSKMAIGTAKKKITEKYGEKYSKTRVFKTKSKGAQEAHEAIRPTFIENETIKGNQAQNQLYSLIWKRTIASQMSDALMEKTIVKISAENVNKDFTANGEVIKFDGFLKVYNISSEDDNQVASLLPDLKVNQELLVDNIAADQKYSNHPPRYTEASLVKQLEDLGIGRPSTYAPTISTVQKRAYVVKENRDGDKLQYTDLLLKDGEIKKKSASRVSQVEKNKLFPTDIGILVNDFLVKYFENILDYNFTASVESEFDKIAAGEEKWNHMIKDFYKGFIHQVEETEEKAEKHSGETLLGKDPKSGKPVYSKIGRYGAMIQIGDSEDEEKPKFASLKKEQSISDISLEEALKLFDFPRELGNFEDKIVTVAIGRFGPYVKHDGKFVSLKKEDDPNTVELERAIELIKEKREADKNKFIKEFSEEPDLQVLNGRYGPYIKYKKKNFKIPKSVEPEKLSLKDCMDIISKSETKKPKSGKRKAKK